MTREDAKKLVPIMQAYAEGKTIQYQTGDGMWVDMSNVVITDIADHYRIKPRQCPFRSEEECFEEMKKHKPFAWVQVKTTGERFEITGFSKNDRYSSVRIGNIKYLFAEAWVRFTFIDGASFGIQ